jgi:hypothetical protein
MTGLGMLEGALVSRDVECRRGSVPVAFVQVGVQVGVASLDIGVHVHQSRQQCCNGDIGFVRRAAVVAQVEVLGGRRIAEVVRGCDAWKPSEFGGI